MANGAPFLKLAYFLCLYVSPSLSFSYRKKINNIWIILFTNKINFNLEMISKSWVVFKQAIQICITFLTYFQISMSKFACQTDILFLEILLRKLNFLFLPFQNWLFIGLDILKYKIIRMLFYLFKFVTKST